MNVSFAPLATVAQSHTYYASGCREIEFVATAATRGLLRAGGIQMRTVDGTLHLLYLAESEGVPVNSIAGQTLVFGLRIANPYFDNFTAPIIADPRSIPLYANPAGAPATLAGPVGVEVVAGIHSHTPRKGTRPVSLSLADAQGAVLDSRVLGIGMESSAYDLRPLSNGRYAITEDYGGGVQHRVDWLVDPELREASIRGVLAIKVDADFYASKAAFALHFTARQETLRYYVVARNFPAQGYLDELNVHDGNGNGLVFTASAMPDGDLKDTLLRDGEAPIAVFESNQEVARRERGLKKLQLRRNTTVLIEHLPLPGPERANSDLIIHLSKPKS